MTPGNEGSEREAMTATRLGQVRAPEATGLPLDQPVVVARSRSPALAVRFGLAGVAVAAAVVGWVLFGDTDPSLWSWEALLAGAGAHAGGHRLLNRRRGATRISQGALARRRFVDLRTAGRACPAVCRALVGQNAEARRVHAMIPCSRKRHRDRPLHRALADGIASALPRRTAARKALEGPARRLGRTGRDRDAKECVQLPDHRRSSRVVLLVDRRRPRLADRSRVADRSLAPWQSPCCGGRSSGSPP